MAAGPKPLIPRGAPAAASRLVGTHRLADLSRRDNWAAALLAGLLLAQLVAWGMNTSMLSALAAFGNLAFALVMLVLLGREAPTNLWRHAIGPAVLLLAAAGWGALGELDMPRDDWTGPLRMAASARDLSLTPDAGRVEIAKLLGLGALTFAASLVGVSARRSRRFVEILAAGGGLYVLFSLALYRIDPGTVFGVSKGAWNIRFSGALLNANAAGCVFAMLCAVSAGLLRGEFNRILSMPRAYATTRAPRAAALAVLLVLLAGACALTQSRTTLVCLAGVLLMMAPWPAIGKGRKNRAAWIAPVLVLTAALGLGVWLAGAGALDRGRYVELSAFGRIQAYENIWMRLTEAPMFGYGLGAFPPVAQVGLTPVQATVLWNFRAAHNAPLQAALEGGTPFLILILAAIGLWLWPTARPSPRSGQRSTLRGVAGAVIVAFACSLVDIALNVPAVASLTFALVGVLTGAAIGARMETGSALRRTPETVFRYGASD